MGLAQALQSFLAEPAKIADVSLVEGTIAGCNYRFFFTSPRNCIEEADGSIPVSSTHRKCATRFRFRDDRQLKRLRSTRRVILIWSPGPESPQRSLG
jgi:hypothetical protein